MGKIKGPLKIAYANIQIEKDDCNQMIMIKRYAIYELFNDHGKHPYDFAIELKSHSDTIDWCKNQLKILEEKEKIISSA